MKICRERATRTALGREGARVQKKLKTKIDEKKRDLAGFEPGASRSEGSRLRTRAIKAMREKLPCKTIFIG